MGADLYRRRPFIISALFIIVACIFVVRLLSLQVLDDTWKMSAENNVVKKVIDYPARGLMYDRNGKLMVYNQAAYDVMVTPREVKEFDTLEFCSIVGETKEDLVAKMNKARKYSTYKPSVVVKQLTSAKYAVLQEKLYKYPGFFVQPRTIRQYPYENAAHILGYVGEVSEYFLKSNPYYARGDYRGITGLEKSYEEELRGQKGVRYKMVDVHNRIKGSFKEAKYDTSAVIGRNLITSIDAELQSYGEELMHGKAGGIVAIEPQTGEILAYISAPNYKPSLFVGSDRGANYRALESDTEYRPLFDRAGLAKYPPGSTFKTLNALIGLQEGAFTEKTRFSCSGVGTYPITCSHSHITPLGIIPAIRESCNPYFWQAFRATLNKYPTSQEGLQAWRDHMLSFGLGQRIAPEIRSESAGNIPSVEFYNRMHHGRWNAMTVRSVSIGQGEVETTSLQMANVAAIIANKGHYIEPHLVKEVVGHDGVHRIPKFEKKKTTIDSIHFIPVIEGMRQVVEFGTGRGSRIDSIQMCGKTGSIQNNKGEAHSSFIAFAPAQDSKIAIYVYVEHGIWGSKFAAPIASLMIEKYLRGSLSETAKVREKRMLDADLLGVKGRIGSY